MNYTQSQINDTLTLLGCQIHLNESEKLSFIQLLSAFLAGMEANEMMKAV